MIRLCCLIEQVSVSMDGIHESLSRNDIIVEVNLDFADLSFEGKPKIFE